MNIFPIFSIRISEGVPRDRLQSWDQFPQDSKVGFRRPMLRQFGYIAPEVGQVLGHHKRVLIGLEFRMDAKVTLQIILRVVGFDFHNLYLAGVTGGNLPGANQTISGSQDMFLGIFDTSGNQLSIRPQGTTSSTNTFSSNCPGCASSGLTFDSNNTLYTSSYSNGSVGGVTNPAGSNNSVFVVIKVK